MMNPFIHSTILFGNCPQTKITDLALCSVLGTEWLTRYRGALSRHTPFRGRQIVSGQDDGGYRGQ